MAVPVPTEVREILHVQVDSIKARLPSARWVRTHQWHLTLAFLGEISVSSLKTVRRSLVAVAQSYPKFPIDLRGGGVFPLRGRAKVAWVGVDSAGLVALHQAVLRALSTVAQLELESRPFQPHLTLARMRSPWKDGAVRSFLQWMDQSWGSWVVSTFHLMSSELLPQGANYHCLEEYSLS